MSMAIDNFLTKPSQSKAKKIFWFTLSMAFAAIYGIVATRQLFSSPYILSEDARAHIFWIQRFIDEQLFPQDLITDYFQSISPPGFSFFYRLLATLGVEPIIVNKSLPLILGLITTACCFGIALEILPVPAVGFVASLLLNQAMWLDSTLGSGIAKAFVYPLFLAFLYYLLRRSYLGVGISIGLLGLFYAPLMLVATGILILRIFTFQGLSPDRRNYWLCIIGVSITLIVSLLYLTQSSQYGPTISVQEARAMPEFLPGGRASFFDDHNPWKFWLQGNRSGIRLSINPALVGLGFLLPILWQFPSTFSLIKETKNLSILLQVTISSLALFFLSHLFLFKLFLPSRYTVHSLLIVMCLAAALVFILIVDGILQKIHQPKTISIALVTILMFILLFYPNLFWTKFPRTGSIVASQPQLYQFFQGQPKDIMIASLSREASNIPIFSQRSILVSHEHALPYHVGYYRQIQQRARDLIDAQYSSDLKLVKGFISRYGVTFFLLDKWAFEPKYLEQNFWFQQWKMVSEKIKKQLAQGNVSYLQKIPPLCTDFENQDFVVINAQCVAKINEQ